MCVCVIVLFYFLILKSLGKVNIGHTNTLWRLRKLRWITEGYEQNQDQWIPYLMLLCFGYYPVLSPSTPVMIKIVFILGLVPYSHVRKDNMSFFFFPDASTASREYNFNIQLRILNTSIKHDIWQEIYILHSNLYCYSTSWCMCQCREHNGSPFNYPSFIVLRTADRKLLQHVKLDGPHAPFLILSREQKVLLPLYGW